MKFQKLVIEPKVIYREPSEDNPYVAILQMSYNEDNMKVVLSPETTQKILHLSRFDIADAATKQINNFADVALAIKETPEDDTPS